MVWSKTDISSTGRGQALDDDKPYILAENLLSNPIADHEWREGGKWTVGADQTLSGYPTTRVNDGWLHLVTKPAPALYTEQHIIVSIEPGTFDNIFIGAHNLRTAGGDLTLTVEVADDSAFTTNLEVVASHTFSSSYGDKRVAFTKVGPAGVGQYSYTGVEWLRISMRLPSGTMTNPQIGEIMIGQRLQLSMNPLTPFDDEQYTSDVVDFVSKAGHVSRYVKSKGRRVFYHSRVASGSDRFLLDDVTTLRSWYKQTEYGTRPFVYVQRPVSDLVAASTTASAYLCQFEDASFSFALQGPFERVGEFSFVEVAPYASGDV